MLCLVSCRLIAVDSAAKPDTCEHHHYQSHVALGRHAVANRAPCKPVPRYFCSGDPYAAVASHYRRGHAHHQVRSRHCCASSLMTACHNRVKARLRVSACRGGHCLGSMSLLHSVFHDLWHQLTRQKFGTTAASCLTQLSCQQCVHLRLKRHVVTLQNWDQSRTFPGHLRNTVNEVWIYLGLR